jgi:diguanylate cyclase (GGDEF)-like protein/PAS domain S-box-containing protein
MVDLPRRRPPLSPSPGAPAPRGEESAAAAQGERRPPSQLRLLPPAAGELRPGAGRRAWLLLVIAVLAGLASAVAVDALHRHADSRRQRQLLLVRIDRLADDLADLVGQDELERRQGKASRLAASLAELDRMAGGDDATEGVQEAAGDLMTAVGEASRAPAGAEREAAALGIAHELFQDAVDDAHTFYGAQASRALRSSTWGSYGAIGFDSALVTWLFVIWSRSRRRIYLSLLAEREHSERHFRSLVQNSSDVIAVIGDGGLLRYVSPPVRRVLGWAPERFVGRRALDLVHPDDQERAASNLQRVLEQPGAALLTELRLRDQAGRWRWVELKGSSAEEEAERGEVILNFRDVTERRELHDQLRYQAGHDPLTRLANRATFSERLARALEARRGDQGRVLVLYLDLDDFKTVNDSFGHEAGDGLLVEVGRRLAATVRGRDLIARLGGDEFAVLVEHGERDTARRLGGRLLDALAKPVRFAGHELAVKASIGIGVSRADDTPEDLLRRADQAMYLAKGAGKGRLRMEDRPDAPILELVEEAL